MVLYKTAREVGKAKIAVEVREEEGTEDVVEAETVGYRFARELREKVFRKWH